MPGLILSAPASGSGKTVVTLGVLRALARRGVPVRGAKSGPDYIDPRFHEAASGRPCPNLDAWAMGEARLLSLAGGEGLLVVEGAMGLFDGASDGRGTTADLARLLGLPVILVVDGSRMAQTAGALVAGLAGHDARVRVAGVILNRVGTERHRRMLSGAVESAGVPVLGALPRSDALAQPSRHLGLVQAAERSDLEAFLEGAADLVERHLDLDRLAGLASGDLPALCGPRMAAPAERIAIARDAAFLFAYPHLLDDWTAQGAQVATFSPLADEAVPAADLIVLPGGYPELHAERLSRASVFMQSLRNSTQLSDVYGECGGYMVLGNGLVDADGQRHAMAGLLDLETSFADRRLHLGYRTVEAQGGPFPGRWAAHEFHYATVVSEAGHPLFRAWDGEGESLAPMGLRAGRVAGSFAHLIDRVDGQGTPSGLGLAP